jgi:hypothetical protein
MSRPKTPLRATQALKVLASGVVGYMGGLLGATYFTAPEKPSITSQYDSQYKKMYESERRRLEKAHTISKSTLAAMEAAKAQPQPAQPKSTYNPVFMHEAGCYPTGRVSAKSTLCNGFTGQKSTTGLAPALTYTTRITQANVRAVSPEKPAWDNTKPLSLEETAPQPSAQPPTQDEGRIIVHPPGYQPPAAPEPDQEWETRSVPNDLRNMVPDGSEIPDIRDVGDVNAYQGKTKKGAEKPAPAQKPKKQEDRIFTNPLER